MNPATTFVKKALFIQHLVGTGQFRVMIDVARTKLWSDTISFGLRRDLTIPFQAPEAAIPLTIRKATRQDVDLMMRLDEPEIPEDEIIVRRGRKREFDAGVKTTYVAVTEDDTPCYFQMLIYPEQNALKRKLWGKVFPVVAPNQVLLEGVLIPTTFRGQRIMPAAMAHVSAYARRDDTTEAITFVDSANIASLKGCVRAGYGPYCHRISRWRLLQETVRFVPIPENTVIPGVTG